MRVYENTNRLSRSIIVRRIRMLDPLAVMELYERDETDGEYRVLRTLELVRVWSSLDDEVILAALAGAETPDELKAIENYRAAAGDFGSLPGWAEWSAAEAAGYMHGQVLNGMSQAEVDAWVDANVTSLAGARAALKMVAGSLISVRGILENLGKAVVFLRDLVVALRR
jgi:hypothetical protein